MSTNEPIVIRGPLHLHSETGTEGGWWAIQDERHIVSDSCEYGHPPLAPHEHWSYDGLHYLEDGDHLKITDPDGNLYWEGRIQLKQHPVFTEEANGFWIHADQAGIDRKFWATPFFKGYKGELIKGLDKIPNP